MIVEIESLCFGSFRKISNFFKKVMNCAADGIFMQGTKNANFAL